MTQLFILTRLNNNYRLK